MGEIRITLTDDVEEDGEKYVRLRADFDPVMKPARGPDGELDIEATMTSLTTVQQIGIFLIETAKEQIAEQGMYFERFETEDG